MGKTLRIEPPGRAVADEEGRRLPHAASELCLHVAPCG